ncbi:MAG: ADP-ribosylglycohydrolase family protein [Anaerolineae bacterium]|nr:ADP-ribosylglycohydrolase family protein [Anaerolineae bacterium]
MSAPLTPFDRAYGALLALAVGDALGMPTSFMTPPEIQAAFGRIEDFIAPLPGHRYHDGLKAAEVTDDTEQSLALARSFIRHHRVDPADVVEELLAWARRVENKYVSPFGPSTERALKLAREGMPYSQTGREGDTNGAGMRIAPLGIIHGVRGSSLEEMARDIALTCQPTHAAGVAVASAGAVAGAIAACFRPGPSIESVLHLALEASRVAEPLGHAWVAPSIPARLEWLIAEVERGQTGEAFAARVYDFFGGGVAAADSIPVALGVFAAAQGDPREALLLSANLGADSDTIAAMAGAVAGAFSGPANVPAEWARRVEQVNGLDFAAVARDLVAVAADWHVA